MSAVLSKMDQAADDARYLIKDGRDDSAVSRAYYAMNYAARAALAHIDPKFAEVKTHQGLVALFSEHLVAAGRLEPRHGKNLRGALNTRLGGDYDADVVAHDEAKQVIEDMEEMIVAVRTFIGAKLP